MAAEYDLPLQKPSGSPWIYSIFGTRLKERAKTPQAWRGYHRLRTETEVLFRWLNKAECRFCAYPGTNMRMRSIKMLYANDSKK